MPLRVLAWSFVLALLVVPTLARGQPTPAPAAAAAARDHLRRVLGAKHADAWRSLLRHDLQAKRLAHARLRDHRASPASGYRVTRTHVRFAANEAAGTVDAVVTMTLQAARAGITRPEFYLTRLDTLEVRDGGGALLFWLGQGGDIPDLALPVEVATLRRGDPRCQERERCGAWRGHDLVVSTGAAEATVGYGRESVLGDLRLVHGGYDLASSYTGCSDWYVASILVAAVPAFPVARPAPAVTRGPAT